MTDFTYIVKCSDGSLYTGWTVNIPRRLKAHNKGTGAKYTRARRPVSLVYYEAYNNRSLALKREYAIKKLSRDSKLRLISSKNFSIIK